MTGNRDPESAGDHSGHYRSSFAAVNSKTADTRIGDYFKLVRVHHANALVHSSRCFWFPFKPQLHFED
ncbi:hypothetical protein HN873_043977 [Arachis hypogaea]